MKYPTPKAALYDLATHGTSATRTEALRLMAFTMPDRFGPYPRKSRESLLRRLICDKTKSAKSRLAAFRELIFGLTLEQQAELERIKKARQLATKGKV